MREIDPRDTENGETDMDLYRAGVSDEAVEALASTSGLHAKYHVKKVDDRAGKHDDCRYFVLDPTHDAAAANAVRYYAELVQASHRDLYDDLMAWLEQVASDAEADLLPHEKGAGLFRGWSGSES